LTFNNKHRIINIISCNNYLSVVYNSFYSLVSHKLKHVTKNLDSKLSYFSINKLGSIIKTYKDSLSILSQKNVVYKFSCKDCNASYAGHAGNWKSVTEHKNHIRRKITIHFVIIEHRLSLFHQCDWNNVEILDRE